MELPRQDGATTYRRGWLARKVLAEADGKKGESWGENLGCRGGWQGDLGAGMQVWGGWGTGRGFGVQRNRFGVFWGADLGFKGSRFGVLREQIWGVLRSRFGVRGTRFRVFEGAGRRFGSPREHIWGTLGNRFGVF